MKKRKTVVLATLSLFIFSLGGVGLYRSMFFTQPVIMAGAEHPSIGDLSAPIELIAFEDFLCRTCKYFSLEVFPAIESTFVERGTAKYVMIPLAFSHRSYLLANAALAVFHQAPEHFFSFVKELFSLNLEERIELEDLVAAASKFKGIDLENLEISINSGRYKEELDRNLDIAKRAMKKDLRVPAIFINGSETPGISFDTISSKIEQMLKERNSL